MLHKYVNNCWKVLFLVAKGETTITTLFSDEFKRKDDFMHYLN